MEIDANNFIKIIDKNFDYEIVDTDLGEGVKVNCVTGFIYSSVTGAGYLDNPLYPFTPKGLMKIFYNAMDYKFVTGLFDNTSLKNSPYLLSKAKPYLFNHDKIIVPVEFENELKLQRKLKDFISVIDEPSTNYIIQRIEKSKNGNGMEPFMEYLACETLKKNNFIVETQIPLTHSTGSPDFGGYKLTTTSNLLFNQIHLIELSLIRLGIERNVASIASNELIVGEAKTSTYEMKKQLDKYLHTALFDYGFEIHPNKSKPGSEYVNLITLNDEFEIKIIERTSSEIFSNIEKQDAYIDWLNNYIKYYLIANLTNDEFVMFFEDKLNRKIASKEDIIYFVNELNFEEIISRINEVVQDGTIQ